jgi:periplasmic divalent cation tolerance protein
MTAPHDVVVVLCTAEPDRAPPLVDRLLDERLIACANLVGPVQSRYRWEGKVEAATETLLVLKTRRDLVPALKAAIATHHGYAVPEVLVLGVDDGLPSYLDWVVSSCRPPDPAGGAMP